MSQNPNNESSDSYNPLSSYSDSYFKQSQNSIEQSQSFIQQNQNSILKEDSLRLQNLSFFKKPKEEEQQLESIKLNFDIQTLRDNPILFKQAQKILSSRAKQEKLQKACKELQQLKLQEYAHKLDEEYIQIKENKESKIEYNKQQKEIEDRKTELQYEMIFLDGQIKQRKLKKEKLMRKYLKYDQKCSITNRKNKIDRLKLPTLREFIKQIIQKNERKNYIEIQQEYAQQIFENISIFNNQMKKQMIKDQSIQKNKDKQKLVNLSKQKLDQFQKNNNISRIQNRQNQIKLLKEQNQLINNYCKLEDRLFAKTQQKIQKLIQQRGQINDISIIPKQFDQALQNKQKQLDSLLEAANSLEKDNYEYQKKVDSLQNETINICKQINNKKMLKIQKTNKLPSLKKRVQQLNDLKLSILNSNNQKPVNQPLKSSNPQQWILQTYQKIESHNKPVGKQQQVLNKKQKTIKNEKIYVEQNSTWKKLVQSILLLWFTLIFFLIVAQIVGNTFDTTNSTLKQSQSSKLLVEPHSIENENQYNYIVQNITQEKSNIVNDEQIDQAQANIDWNEIREYFNQNLPQQKQLEQKEEYIAIADHEVSDYTFQQETAQNQKSSLFQL